MTMATDEFQDWVGRSQTLDGLITGNGVDMLSATFDRDDAPVKDGTAIPPGWYTLFLREVGKLADTGRDGHPRTGNFVPPIPLPRRMWAGTRTTFLKPLHVGERIRRLTTLTALTPKTGRTGELCFVTLTHEVSGDDGVAVREVQDVVYREEAKQGAAPPRPAAAPQNAAWTRTIHPTPVLLFRISALTMNSHRIHYDRGYATEVEGYPGLVVHGTLTNMLLLDLLRRQLPDATLETFHVRAVSPLFDTDDFTIAGNPGDDGKSASLWAANHEGVLAMTAEATFAG